MPRVLTFDVEIRTGDAGTNTPVRCCINGHTMPFEEPSGTTESGGLYKASFRVMSFIHSLTIVGPDEGMWNIDELGVTYHCADMEPYDVRFGAVVLDEETEVNIWAEQKPTSFYV